MAADRRSLTLTESSTNYPFAILPGDNNISIEQQEWEAGSPTTPWRVPLHPWWGGMNIDRFGQVRGYAKGPIDASNDSILVPGPLVNSLTLTSNAVTGIKMVEFDSKLFIACGTRLYYVDSAYSVTLDETFGSAITDICVFNNELVAGFGATAAVLQTRNTAGTWTAAAAGLYAQHLCVVDEKLWRSHDTNQVDSCLTAPGTVASWTTANYSVGDTSMATTCLMEYGGVLWVGKPDGMYQADPASRFHNQTPQLRRYPHSANCFPGETLVALDETIEAVYRRRYRGRLVNLLTASGHKLAGTPNHPILTDRGWVAIGKLKKGDRVVSRSLGQRASAGNPDVKYPEASMEEIFRAASNVLAQHRMVGSAMDFHGDGQDGDVDVVAIGGELRDRFMAALAKPRQHLGFAPADVPCERSAGLSAATQFVTPPLHPAHSVVHGSSGQAALFGGHSGVAQPVGIASRTEHPGRLRPPGDGRLGDSVGCGNNRRGRAADVLGKGDAFINASSATIGDAALVDDVLDMAPGNAVALREFPIARARLIGSSDRGVMTARSGGMCAGARWNPGLSENLVDGAAGYAEAASENFSAFPCEVEFDEVVDVGLGESEFDGYVYNLQTSSNRYSAASIVAHNCIGSFTAWGYLWCPTVTGLLRVQPGESLIYGPELSNRPDFRFWVRGGAEWGGAIWLVCTDESAVSSNILVKMVRDKTGASGRPYVYHEMAQFTGDARCIGISSKPTNPTVYWSHDNDARYVKLGRGAGRDIDDPNCLLGDSTISASAGIVAVSRRSYTGQVVVFNTANGFDVSATPNHPILTTEGWVAAGLLKEGDRVVSRSLSQKAGARDPNVEDVQATIAEIYDFLAILGPHHRTSGVEQQFHGDGQDGEVDVVSIDGELGDRIKAALAQHNFKSLFPSSSLGDISLARLRNAAHLLVGANRPPSGLPRRAKPSLAGVHRLPVGNNLSGFPEGAKNDAIAGKVGVDRPGAYAEAFAEGIDTLSGEVTFDDIVSIRRKPFSGHVYNLQSSDGWYLANNVVVHNCGYATSWTMESGNVQVTPDLATVATLVGVTTVLDYDSTEQLLVTAAFDDQSYPSDFLTTQEGGGSAAITNLTNWQSVTRYAPSGAQGQFLRVKLTGSQVSGSSAGTDRPQIRECWAWGYMHPQVTDVITCILNIDPKVLVNGVKTGKTINSTKMLFNRWRTDGTILTMALPEYAEGQTVRVFVSGVKEIRTRPAPGAGITQESVAQLQVTLTRIAFATTQATGGYLSTT